MGLLRKLVLTVVAVGGACAAAGWYLTAPETLDPSALAGIGAGDAVRGERIFWAGGCASCHAKEKSEGPARLELAGGLALKTPFGTFVAPNISPHRSDGIGGWSFEQFANAMMKGVSPAGEHYYPAFPYTSYARMAPADVADLFAFIMTLPAVEGRPPGHDLGFPFNVRRGLGLWKRLNLSDEPVVALPADAPAAVLAGRYLVEGPLHCGECHTPRDMLGAPKRSAWLSGGPAAEGKGNVPNITSGEGGIGDWTESDIVTLLKDGFTPDFDSPGGAMADVVKSTARLPDGDLAAIAAYIKAVPPLPNGNGASTPN